MNKKLLLPLLMLIIAPQAHATWYYPNVDKGSDIVMVDLRWPYWPKGTYFALWNMATYPEGGPFYGGVAPYGPGKEGSQKLHEAYEPQLVWSFWGSDKYKGDRVRSVFFDAPFYGGSMSGEGATAGICGFFPYLRPNHWMRMVMRAWPSLDNPQSKGYVGWWVRDVELDRWYNVGVVSIPCKVSGFQGNACFVEDTGAGRDSDRLFDRRLGYHRLDGQWKKTDSIWIDGKVPKTRFSIIENDTVLRFELPTPKPPKDDPVSKHHYTVKQADTPILDQPAIGQADAAAADGQVVVKWTIPGNATPQLRYKIELFASSNATGKPLSTVDSPMPHNRIENVKATAQTKSVRLTITDIFDNQISRVMKIKTPAPMPAITAASLRPGLQFSYFEAPQGADWKKIPDFTKIAPLRRGVVNSLDDTISLGRKTLYAIRYSGFIRVPTTGIYIFEPRTCDGSRLIIDEKLVADNDGVHSTTIRRYSVSLAKGLHAVEMEYFKSSYAKMDGWLSGKLWLSMEGPGLELRTLGRGDFMCSDNDTIPTVILDSPASGSPDGNRFTLKPQLNLKGHKITRIEYYRGRIKLGQRLANDLQKDGDEAFETVLPQGDNNIWVRLWYGGGNAVDSNVANFPATDVKQGPWEYTVIGEKELPQGINADDKQVSLSGEGMVFAHRSVEGDFVLTGHIEDFLHSTRQNGVNGSSLMGLMAAGNAANPWGCLFGMWDTAGRGLRGASDDRDLETSRMNRDSLGKSDRWVRIARREMRWIAYTSPDGVNWKKVIDRIDRKFADQVQVGVAFWTIPGKNKMLFHGTVNKLNLQQPGVLPDEKRERIDAKYLNAPGRINALVGSNNDTTLYARGNGTGIIASSDDGETWKPVNNGLTSPEALAVRSIAVDPQDPSIILRAGGCDKDGKLVSGLWKSFDSGASWKMVSEAIDFDGTGTSALFGEVLSFNPYDPNVVAAGGETSGLYFSTDRGETWEYAALKGQRITCLAYNPYNKGSLIVGTCADSEMRKPGLGKSVLATGNMGRIYKFTGSKGNKVLLGEMADFGITNMAFEGRNEGQRFIYLATTRGLYYTFYQNKFYQRRAGVAADVLYTAINEWLIPERKTSRILAGPLSGEGGNVVYSASIGYYWSPVWKKVSGDAGIADGGICSIVSDGDNGEIFWVCNGDGIYKTTDGGKNYRVVYANKSNNSR